MLKYRCRATPTVRGAGRTARVSWSFSRRPFYFSSICPAIRRMAERAANCNVAFDPTAMSRSPNGPPRTISGRLEAARFAVQIARSSEWHRKCALPRRGRKSAGIYRGGNYETAIGIQEPDAPFGGVPIAMSGIGCSPAAFFGGNRRAGRNAIC